jgi:hypothetical protein
MDVSQWTTPALFFAWPHVQQYIDRIDPTVYRTAIKFAQAEYLSHANPCPECGRAPSELRWLSVSDPESAWDAGTGRVGFLTICERCQRQVDFLVDRESTAIQEDEWRECRTLF